MRDTLIVFKMLQRVFRGSEIGSTKLCRFSTNLERDEGDWSWFSCLRFHFLVILATETHRKKKKIFQQVFVVTSLNKSDRQLHFFGLGGVKNEKSDFIINSSLNF